MTKKQFKIWLIENDITQKQLAEKLGIDNSTISRYCANNRFPKIFTLALQSVK
tara:strand:- start:8 stop:166 length:159 start_codon:yes stop_codon:yes gene_type:complete